MKMLRHLYPAVPRHWLFAIAGVMWTAVGVLLCVRAIVWIAPFTLGTDLLVETLSGALAAVGYIYGLSKTVQKNIMRIHGLPDRACAFAFTAWSGYLMIGVMMTLGIALRGSSFPKYYLSVPYTAMGGMLLIGSVRLFRQFLVVAYQSSKQ